jgi:copper chaperone
MTNIETPKHDLGLVDTNQGCSCSSGEACACGTHDHHEDHGHHEAESGITPAQTADYLVDGMTCSHCVSSVTEEISALSGVEGVTVQLKPGGSSTVSVASSAALDRDAIRVAIEEAGYSLAGDLR